MGSVISAHLDIEKISGAAPTMRAYRVTGSWSSSTITWANKPNYTTTHQSTQSTPVSSGSSWYRMDVTSMVNAWVDGNYTNYGFVLVDSVENNPDHWTTLYSSDADSPHKPKLIISYSEPGIISPPSPDPYPDAIDKYFIIRYSPDITDRAYLLSEFNAAANLFLTTFEIDILTHYVTTDYALTYTGCEFNNNLPCNNGSATSCGVNSQCGTLHHKSAVRLLNINQSSEYYTCRIVDYVVCSYNTTTGVHDGYGGMSNKQKDMVVSTTQNNLKRYIMHEISHSFGARDEVCNSTQSCCMNLTGNSWCDVCAEDIREYISREETS